MTRRRAVPGRRTKPLARYALRLNVVVLQRKPALFPMLIDEAMRLVTQQEPSHDNPQRSYQSATPAHDG